MESLAVAATIYAVVSSNTLVVAKLPGANPTRDNSERTHATGPP
jgi:hypothetical protein